MKLSDKFALILLLNGLLIQSCLAVRRDWSRVMCDPHCRPSATMYCSLIALEPSYIAGNSTAFSIKKTSEYLVNRKLEEEAGECSICRYPIVESAPKKQEGNLNNNSGPVSLGIYNSTYRRSPGQFFHGTYHCHSISKIYG